MKLSERLLTFLNLIILSLFLFFVYGYLNGLVSYKYEVQADEFAGNILNGHQREILEYVSSNETGLWICLALLLTIFVILISRPNFKGKIVYVR